MTRLTALRPYLYTTLTIERVHNLDDIKTKQSEKKNPIENVSYHCFLKDCAIKCILIRYRDTSYNYNAYPRARVTVFIHTCTYDTSLLTDML